LIIFGRIPGSESIKTYFLVDRFFESIAAFMISSDEVSITQVMPFAVAKHARKGGGLAEQELLRNSPRDARDYYR
jgi:hypothetical protein